MYLGDVYGHTKGAHGGGHGGTVTGTRQNKARVTAKGETKPAEVCIVKGAQCYVRRLLCSVRVVALVLRGQR